MLFLFAVLSGSHADARTGRALVVAIGKYPMDSGWENIHGDNDGILISDLLKRNYYQQIILLKNERATKKNINLSLQRLYEDVKAGDYLFCIFLAMGSR